MCGPHWQPTPEPPGSGSLDQSQVPICCAASCIDIAPASSGRRNFAGLRLTHWQLCRAQADALATLRGSG
eukprot:1757636-Rhodomonas_salina.1